MISFMRNIKFVSIILLLVIAGCSHAETTSTPTATALPAPPEFLVHDNDIWVQLGDSITGQALYTTYLEAFIRARYPKLKFVAINSGKSGDATIHGLVRFRGTVAAFKPTLVTSAFGMNDQVKTFPNEREFQDNPQSAVQRLTDMVMKLDARYLMISSSPVLSSEKPEDATTVPPTERNNFLGRDFADKLKIVAERNGVPFLDIMAPLRTVWAQNYPRDQVAAMRRGLASVLDTPIEGENWRVRAVLLSNPLKPFLNNPELVNVLPAPDKENLLSKWKQPRHNAEDWETFRKYLQDWAKIVDESTPPFVQVSGYTNSSRFVDLIHPNEAGHLHIAAILFKLMGGDGLVSDVSIDAKASKVINARKAAVRDVSLQNGVLSFKRLDESLPLPIDALARPSLGVDVSTPLGTPKNSFGMSRYLLTVKNLPKGNYEIAIDNEMVFNTSSDELSRGIDAGMMDKGPIAEQAKALLETVRANVIMAVPAKGQPMVSTDFAPKVLDEAQPKEHTWSIRPVK